MQVEIAHSKTFLDAVLLLQAPMPAGGACGSADVCVGACVYGCVWIFVPLVLGVWLRLKATNLCVCGCMGASMRRG